MAQHALLLFCALLDNSLTQRHVRPLVDRLLALLKPLDQTLGLQVVLAECALTCLLKGAPQLKPEWLDEFRRVCLAAIERRAPFPERHKLGLCLGELGDPRIVVDLREQAGLDGLGRSAWVKVPAGEYPLGDDIESDNPPRLWTLPHDIWLTRYPITNGQFAVFIEDGGYDWRELWLDDDGKDDGWKWRQAEKLTAPRFWQDAKWNGKNQPVVGVSCYEAEAFARWAGGRLPSENEWEAAARGPLGHTYPWGNDRNYGICNSAEARLGVTSAVGVFPDSAPDPLGLQDMAGNVWEWCADRYDERASSRVFRGGCWSAGDYFCRSARRSGISPDDRSRYVGLRVALRQSNK